MTLVRTHLQPAPRTPVAAVLFSKLLGRRVDVVHSKPMVLPQKQITLAFFIDSTRRLVVMGIADAALTCRAGAALTHIPAGVAEEGLRRGVSPMLLDNFREVMNVTARLLTHPEGPTARLERTSYHADHMPEELITQSSQPLHSVGWELRIEGYGAGKLTLLEL